MLASKLIIITQISISSIPTKINPYIDSLSFSFHHTNSNNNYNSKNRLLLSSELFTLSQRRRRLMGERVIKIPALRSGDVDVVDDDTNNSITVLEQENLVGVGVGLSSKYLSSGFESTLNNLSKWLTAATFAAVVLWRHDPKAVWVVMGSVLNSILSVVLKRVLNQERPLSNLRSDPGMPSSHAQSIFFAVVFIILSMVEWLGVNEFTLIFAVVSLALASYFSWLRVAQQFHTVSQVTVGAIIGSCFSLLWAWSWDAFVGDAFTSLFWARVAILLGSAICSLGFIMYVVLNWFTDER